MLATILGRRIMDASAGLQTVATPTDVPIATRQARLAAAVQYVMVRSAPTAVSRAGVIQVHARVQQLIPSTLTPTATSAAAGRRAVHPLTPPALRRAAQVAAASVAAAAEAAAEAAEAVLAEAASAADVDSLKS